MSPRLALALMAVGHLHPQRTGGPPSASVPLPRVEGTRPAEVSQTIAALAAHWLESKKPRK